MSTGHRTAARRRSHRSATRPVGTSTTQAPEPTIDDLLQAAIDSLKRELTPQVQTVSSHQVTIVHGIEQQETMEAFATYALIADIGQGIRVNLAIAAEVLGGSPNFGTELQQQVERIIGANNAIQDDFREDQRDPWFTECLGHALLNISRDVLELAPPGPIQALTLVHTDVRDHGLDLVGLHLEQALLGLHISEAKASENNASNHGSATAKLFAEVDAGSRDPEIRGKVQLLREALPQGQQRLVTPSFWHGQRAYVAVICYSANSSFAPAHARPAYARLAVGAQRIRLLAVPLSNYRQFFDTIADRVRALVPVVARAGGGT
jgi:hypothetical protein